MPPSTQNKPLASWKPIEEIDRDIDRMLICSVCGGDACFGFEVTLQGVRMGDVGDWRCAEHHPEREARMSREQWADAIQRGIEMETVVVAKPCPPINLSPGALNPIEAELVADLPADQGAREVAVNG